MFMFSSSIFFLVASINVFLGRKKLKGTGVGGLKGHQNKLVRFKFFYFWVSFEQYFFFQELDLQSNIRNES